MKKTISDYERDIKIEYAALHKLPDFHPEYDKTKARLSRQLTAWVNLLNISIQVASNEQLPYSSAELGLPCSQMQTKKESSSNQVGDYIAYLEDYNQFAGIVIERKTLNDFYSSLMHSDHRARLMREIGRYKTDDRFNRFILIAECTYEEFLGYVPAIFVCQWETIPGAGASNLIKYLKKYYKINGISPKQIYKTDSSIIISCDKKIEIKLQQNSTAPLSIDGVQQDILYIETKYGKRNLYQKKGATEVSKVATINSLENNIQVSFVGGRERAVQKLPGLIRQWCRRNYITILNI
ncbi:MAG: ERCC4 domain-containing protein [Methanosarcinaceae archaeon]